jgi:hypothetical protein
MAENTRKYDQFLGACVIVLALMLNRVHVRYMIIGSESVANSYMHESQGGRSINSFFAFGLSSTMTALELLFSPSPPPFVEFFF